jgi:ubiquinone/menaquinone biosynthesis C-methylase UbiE
MATMSFTNTNSTSGYALGYTDAEHERLIWQAERAAPLTERLFREAGIGLGQRVLDLGSGVADVTMLAARLVGPSGEVVGIERDARSIARARARVAEAGLPNVSFVQCDVSQFASDKLFDAVVGRLILMYLPDPAAVLRSLLRSLRPGGVVAFHEWSSASLLSVLAPLPLWYATASLMREAFNRSGANPYLGLAVARIFQEAGLPPPTARLEILLEPDPDVTRWMYDLVCSLRPQMQQLSLSLDTLGDLATLRQRLHAEIASSNNVTPYGAGVGAWSRKCE